jgi:DNA oxidative demethylase
MTALIPRPRADIAPGAIHIPGWLSRDEQRRLVAAGRLNVTLRESGLG